MCVLNLLEYTKLMIVSGAGLLWGRDGQTGLFITSHVLTLQKSLINQHFLCLHLSERLSLTGHLCSFFILPLKMFSLVLLCTLDFRAAQKARLTTCHLPHSSERKVWVTQCGQSPIPHGSLQHTWPCTRTSRPPAPLCLLLEDGPRIAGTLCACEG